MSVNSPGAYGSQISPKSHTPKSPRHFVFPQKSPSVVSSGSSGYYTPQSGCSYDRSPNPTRNGSNRPPKSPKLAGMRSPKSPRQFIFGQDEQQNDLRSSPVPDCNHQMPPKSPVSTSSPIAKHKKGHQKVGHNVPVHIHTNPGYVSPSGCSSRYNSNSTLNKRSPYSSSNNLDNGVRCEDENADGDDEISVRRCRKSTSDLTEQTDETQLTRSTSCSRPCSPMRRGSMKGGLAYLASRRGSRDSAASNCSKEDIGPLNFQNTVRGRQRRTSNFLELPVVAHARPRVCSLPEQPLNPRISEDLYRLRTFSITNKGSVVNCGDSIISRRSRSNTSVNTTASRASDRSPFEGSCCSGYQQVDSSTPSSPVADEAPQIPKYRVVLLGDSGVGKTALVSQFMTSEYMNTYDASLDDEFGEKSVSVLLDGEESELVFIDHPSVEMSVENSLSTYDPHACIVVYSVTARSSFVHAQELLNYLWRENYTKEKSVIVVGNKADLARARVISINEGKGLATSRECKFIETSSGIQHNVDELLVGVLKQVRLKLNGAAVCSVTSTTPATARVGAFIKSICRGDPGRTKSCENLHVL